MACLANRLPKASFVVGTMKVLHITFTVADPYLLPKRPCEATIRDAEELLNKERANYKKNPMGIQLPGFGNFDLDGLDILKKFCFVCETKKIGC